ncbi:MAG TPA: homocysteine S-methyltransferase family protein [Methylomirabilota bacterium]|jgi:betaine-homocysteine S-methyltransferase|nr:homocysteine S-methyltransferase family protein [Methylomirabilota bacterium]
MAKGLLERLREGVVLGDGGYVLELEKRGYVLAGPFTPECTVTNPEAVLELSREFADAGAEVIQALAFYGDREKLATVGFGERVGDINRAAVRLARQAAGDRALVAGNLSMTWQYEPESPKARDRVHALLDEQLGHQLEVGIDFVIAETYLYLGEAVLAAARAKRSGLPVMVTMSFEEKPVTRDGKSPAECAKALADAGADIVGTNCWRGPQHILPIVEEMRKATSAHIAVQAPAYRTTDATPFFTGLKGFPDAMEPYQLTRWEMAEYARQAKALGANFIGACCGAVATHIREMARALGKPTREPSRWKPDPGKPMSATEFYRDRRAKSRD